MTILTSESRLAGTALGNLPRVNLLPPEIAERAAFRKVQYGLGAAVLAAVGVVGLLYVGANHSVANAQQDLDGATQQNVALQRQVGQYRDVTATYSQAAAAQAQLSTAMGDEVRYSQLLNDLSLSIPGNVWLSNVTFSQTPPAAPAAGAAAAVGTPGIGTVTVSGVAFSHDDVAVWLESIASLKTYTTAYFANSTEALIGTRKTVNFTSTATLTPAALSGRYNKPIGG